jgi:hypothetical protein
MRGIIATAYKLHQSDIAVVLVETDKHPGSDITGTRYVLRITRNADKVDITEDSGEVYSTARTTSEGYEQFKEVVFGAFDV